MLTEFLTSVGGVTNAATILGVSGTVIHKWKREGVSVKATRRIQLWLAYNVEHERFILRNVWAHEDKIWTPSASEYRAWAVREFSYLRERVGLERSSSLWKEVME